MFRLSVVLMLLWITPAKATDSLSCIQQPNRLKACPHLLYRVAQLPDMPTPAVICICVTDFSAVLNAPADDAEQIKQNMAKRQLEAQHGAKLQTVLDILQRRI